MKVSNVTFTMYKSGWVRQTIVIELFKSIVPKNILPEATTTQVSMFDEYRKKYHLKRYSISKRQVYYYKDDVDAFLDKLKEEFEK